MHLISYSSYNPLCFTSLASHLGLSALKFDYQHINRTVATELKYLQTSVTDADKIIDFLSHLHRQQYQKILQYVSTIIEHAISGCIALHLCFLLQFPMQYHQSFYDTRQHVKKIYYSLTIFGLNQNRYVGYHSLQLKTIASVAGPSRVHLMGRYWEGPASALPGSWHSVSGGREARRAVDTVCGNWTSAARREAVVASSRAALSRRPIGARYSCLMSAIPTSSDRRASASHPE